MDRSGCSRWTVFRRFIPAHYPSGQPRRDCGADPGYAGGACSTIDERDPPEDVGSQALLSVLLLQGLLPEGRGELEDAASGPGLQERQNRSRR